MSGPGKQPSRGRSDPPARRRRTGLLAGTALVLVAADLITKVLAVELLAGRSVKLLGGLVYLTEARNTGAAFSFAEGATVLFTLVAAVVIVVIVRTAARLRSAPWAICLGLILGGAAGNLVDRVFRSPSPLRGAVIDWISLLDPYGRVWPIFNLADSGIVVGGITAVALASFGYEMDGRRQRGDVVPTPRTPGSPAVADAGGGDPHGHVRVLGTAGTATEPRWEEARQGGTPRPPAPPDPPTALAESARPAAAPAGGSAAGEHSPWLGRAARPAGGRTPAQAAADDLARRTEDLVRRATALTESTQELGGPRLDPPSTTTAPSPPPDPSRPAGRPGPGGAAGPAGGSGAMAAEAGDGLPDRSGPGGVAGPAGGSGATAVEAGDGLPDRSGPGGAAGPAGGSGATAAEAGDGPPDRSGEELGP